MDKKEQSASQRISASRSKDGLSRFAGSHFSYRKQQKMDGMLGFVNHFWVRMIGTFISLSSSMGLARFLSWIFLLIIFIFSIFLSVFIGTSTRTTLLEGQESYTLLVAENMNKQIFRKFTLPVAYASGRVALSEPDQYKLLEETITSLTQGIAIDKIKIYDTQELVAFSTDKEEVQRTDLTYDELKLVFAQKKPFVSVQSEISYFEAFFNFNLPDGSFVMRTVYPLTIDFELGPFNLQKLSNEEGGEPILGALEITQDITNLYRTAISLQWNAFLGFAFAIFSLFVITLFVVRTAERLIRERIEQNASLEKELLQSEKLASMGRMVASIAHEVRNPLGIIKSSSEYLLNRKDNDTTQKNLLGAIFDETSRLGVTVNDFLDYARPRNPGNTETDLVKILEKVEKFLGPNFEQNKITLDFQLPETLPFFGDEDALYRAFYNLFVNAQQAMTEDDKSGKSVEANENIEHTFDVIAFVNKNGMITIRFVDNGPGFSTEQESIDKMLDPFYTTKHSGTGLGLAIVQSIIKAHSGEIFLYNGDGGGAVVEVVFTPTSA